MASGRPSSRAQISATAGAFSARQREVRLDCLRALDEERRPPRPRRARSSGRQPLPDPAAPAAARGTRCSPRTWSGARLVTSTFSCGARRQQLGDAAGAASSTARSCRGPAAGAWLPDTRRRLSRRELPPASRTPSVAAIVGSTKAGIGEWRQIDEEDTILEVRRALRQPPAAPAASCPSHRHRSASPAARPRAASRSLEHGHHLRFASDQRVRLDRQIGFGWRSRLLSGGKSARESRG